MEKISRTVGRCLTETKRKDFDAQLSNFGEFVSVSQFSAQPKHVSQFEGQLTDSSHIDIGTILYGVEQDGSLTWLGEIIDSSD